MWNTAPRSSGIRRSGVTVTSWISAITERLLVFDAEADGLVDGLLDGVSARTPCAGQRARPRPGRARRSLPGLGGPQLGPRPGLRARKRPARARPSPARSAAGPSPGCRCRPAARVAVRHAAASPPRTSASGMKSRHCAARRPELEEPCVAPWRARSLVTRVQRSTPACAGAPIELVSRRSPPPPLGGQRADQVLGGQAGDGVRRARLGTEVLGEGGPRAMRAPYTWTVEM